MIEALPNGPCPCGERTLDSCPCPDAAKRGRRQVHDPMIDYYIEAHDEQLKRESGSDFLATT